ncbi:MAG: PRC-barrel domain protein [Methanobacteriota archaeon]|nr:MAG: PRC-barrel domain protein [Euryarchaeota archaeon]
MKRFATELKGKTVMTDDGQILGILEDFIMDTRTGKIDSILVNPADTVETRLFKTDPQGRLILGFRTMRAIQDVIVTEIVETK